MVVGQAASAAGGGRAYPSSPVTLGGGWTAQWDTAVNADGTPAQQEGYGGVAFSKFGHVLALVPFDDLFPEIMQPTGSKSYRLDAHASLRTIRLLPQHDVSELQVTFDRCAPQCRPAAAYVAIHPKPQSIRTASDLGKNELPLDSVFRIAGVRMLPDGRRLVFGAGADCGTDLIIVPTTLKLAARPGDDLLVYGSWATRAGMSVDERFLGAGAQGVAAARALCRGQR